MQTHWLIDKTEMLSLTSAKSTHQWNVISSGGEIPNFTGYVLLRNNDHASPG